LAVACCGGNAKKIMRIRDVIEVERIMLGVVLKRGKFAGQRAQFTSYQE